MFFSLTGYRLCLSNIHCSTTIITFQVLSSVRIIFAVCGEHEVQDATLYLTSNSIGCLQKPFWPTCADRLVGENPQRQNIKKWTKNRLLWQTLYYLVCNMLMLLTLVAWMNIFTADLAVWLKPVSVLSDFTNNANTNQSHYPKSQHTCTTWTKTWSWGLLIHIFWYKNGLGVITTYLQFCMCHKVLSHNRNPILLLLFFFKHIFVWPTEETKLPFNFYYFLNFNLLTHCIWGQLTAKFVSIAPFDDLNLPTANACIQMHKHCTDRKSNKLALEINSD